MEEKIMSITFEFFKTNGIQLHCALAGPKDGVPVILLHGFPESWFGWKNQIGPLVKSGFRVIVPDQRGYNLSDKPAGSDQYKMNILVDDILGLADKLGYDKFFLGGHDFGAMVSWSLALRAPERIRRMAIANVPHPSVFRGYLKTRPAQMLKSWYAIFFQLPGIPELFVKAGNWKFLIQAMPEYWEEEQYDRYREAWSQPGASTAMINWYRATFSRSGRSRKSDLVQPPTLLIWGKKDPHLSYQMAPLSLELCQDGELVWFENATHWVQHDQAQEVSQLLIDHFQKD